VSFPRERKQGTSFLLSPGVKKDRAFRRGTHPTKDRKSLEPGHGSNDNRSLSDGSGGAPQHQQTREDECVHSFVGGSCHEEVHTGASQNRQEPCLEWPYVSHSCQWRSNPCVLSSIHSHCSGQSSSHYGNTCMLLCTMNCLQCCENDLCK
jgi:hypothetical protein